MYEVLFIVFHSFGIASMLEYITERTLILFE